MAMIPYAEYRPDVSDINRKYTSTMSNVLPRADGYGPFTAVQPYTSALPAQCQGYFQANNLDGSVTYFAGTSTLLYVLDNTTLTWSNVSLGGGPYSALSSDANWQFAQFNSFVIAVQANVVPQVWDLASSTAFAALGGSPPQAGGIAIINRFALLYDLLSNPNRIQWSGLNATTTWSSGVTFSDYQDLPDGGRVRGVAGGEYGLVLQARAIRRMIFVPGSPIAFQIERIAPDRGIFAPYSLCAGGGKYFFLSSNGFIEASGDGGMKPIGFERVDRTMLADIDTGNLQLCVGAVDPNRYTAVFAYKSKAGNAGRFDKALAYNWQLEQWSPLTMDGEYLAAAAVPGATLESLDAIASGVVSVTGAVTAAGLIKLTVSSTSGMTTGDIKDVKSIVGTIEANGTWTITVVDATHITLDTSVFANAYVSGGIIAGSVDAMTTSFDELSTVALPSLAIINSDHKLGYFTGAALEAVLETPETIGTRQRVNINGAQPITDATTCYVSVGGRDVLNGALAYGDETALDADGYCPLLANVRSGRIRLRIAAGETWTFASGVEPEIMPAGRF